MNDASLTLLHYSMLEYVYEHRLLVESMSNYVWEDFKVKNAEFHEKASGKGRKQISDRELTFNDCRRPEADLLARCCSAN